MRPAFAESNSPRAGRCDASTDEQKNTAFPAAISGKTAELDVRLDASIGQFDSCPTGTRFHLRPPLWGELRQVTRRDELGA